ncbi:hypothetical protein ACQEVC_02210 [Plantactinospora sp. CA-294935]
MVVSRPHQWFRTGTASLRRGKAGPAVLVSEVGFLLAGVLAYRRRTRS